MIQERRRYVRIPATLQVSFERKGPGETLREQGTTKNVSPLGICLSSPVLLGVGEKISVSLRLPTGETVAFESRVKWVESCSSISHDIGLEISDIPLEDQNRYFLFVCDLMYDRLNSLQADK